MYHAIMFHHFHGGKHPQVQGSISQEEFEQIIIHIKQHFNLLSCESWYEKFLEQSLTDRDVCLTFDDGLLCQYDIAFPVMEKYSLKAFWFIYTTHLTGNIERLEIYRYFRNEYFHSIDDFYEQFFELIKSSKSASKVEKALTGFVPEKYLEEFSFYTRNDRIYRFLRDQVLTKQDMDNLMDALMAQKAFNPETLKSLLWIHEEGIKNLSQKGHFIGVHSHTHPTNISKLGKAEQEKEFKENYKILTEITSVEPAYMSHPCNSYNDTTLEILKGMGIKLGFRANMAKEDFSTLEVPRKDHIYILKEIKDEDYCIHK